MDKMAVFVEGQTEQLFVERLIKEIAGARSVQLDSVNMIGRVRTVKLKIPDPLSEKYVLIVNSGSDSTVASDVRENYDSLVRNGYSAMLALRDVYPHLLTDLPALQRRLGYGVKTKPIQVSFVLAVMEIEAWFLAEHTHFERLHSDLTADRIAAVLGFDPRVDDMAQRGHPAGDLHAAYKLVGLAYTKRRANALRTIGALDFAALYLEVIERMQALKVLVLSIDSFVSKQAVATT